MHSTDRGSGAGQDGDGTRPPGRHDRPSDGTPPAAGRPPVPSIAAQRVALLRRLEVYSAWFSYRFFPSETGRADLDAAVGEDAGAWLAAFADACRRFPSTYWVNVITDRRERPDTPAMLPPAVASTTFPLHQREVPGRRARPRLLCAVGVAAAAVAVVLGATALVLSSRSPSHPSTPRSTLVATWTLAGDIDQPAWRVAAGGGTGSAYLDCPSTTTCVANVTGSPGGPSVERSADGGTSWTPRDLPAGVQLSAGLTCPAPGTCVGTGVTVTPGAPDQAVVVVTSDSGSTWTEHPLPAGVARVVALSCPAVSACVGVGFAGPPSLRGTTSSERAVVVRSADGGASWSAAGLSQSLYPTAEGLACASPQDCVLAGTTTADAAGQLVPTTAVILATDDGGATWTTATLPAGLGLVEAVSCAPAGGCIAFADHGPRTTADRYVVLRSPTADGRTWQAAGGAGLSLSFVLSVSCPTPDDCWASGLSAPAGGQRAAGAIAATDDGGTSWTAAALPQQVTGFEGPVLGTTDVDLVTVSAVSCPTARACVALASTEFSKPTVAQLVLRSDGPPAPASRPAGPSTTGPAARAGSARGPAQDLRLLGVKLLLRQHAPVT